MHCKQRGFTLIELLIAVAILGILLGIAMPAYSGFMEAGRASAAKSALFASLTSTATRATITGAHSVLCSSSDGNRCSGDLDWSAGWIAFVDHNGNRERDSGEPLITAHGKLDGKVRLQTTKGRTKLVFQPNGGNAGSNVTFTLCDGRGASRAETLVLSNGGRMRSGKPSQAAIASACATG